jgi:hypothetical protein
VDARAHIDALKARLANSPAVRSLTVVQERASLTSGFLRVRLTLTNSDFVEIAEFFVIGLSGPQTVEYRYQWMDAGQ